MSDIFASSFNRAVAHMNSKQCAFITAFRGEYSTKQNRRRNKLLESDIRASGLTFIRATGGFIENRGTDDEQRVSEDTFCVVNNRFPEKEFLQLAIQWCKDYDQDAVLVTTPKKEKSGNAINVVGVYYDKNGNIDMKFDHATIQDAEEYFTNILGKDFVLSSTEYVATRFDNSTVTGKILGREDFYSIYGTDEES